MEVGGEYVVVAAFAQAGPVHLYRVTSRRNGRRYALHAAASSCGEAPSLEHLADLSGAQVPTALRAGYDAERGVAWLVTEPVAGRHLPELVAEVGPVPLSLVSSVVQQALDAVAGAHEVGRVHGALTPGCIFVEPAGGRGGGARVTVVGFGPAGPRGREAAPSPAADVTAIGALTLWMLSGGRVEFGSVVRAVDRGEARVAPSERLREVGATDVTLPSWFDGWFEGCVAPESAGRFASAADAEAAWEQSVAVAPAPTSRARLVVAAAAAVALAGAAVAGEWTVGAHDAVGSIRPASSARPAVSPSRCPAGMAWIPGGQTMMGTREGRGDADQHPRHVVNITGFCLDRTEVTVSDYGRYWVATGRRPGAAPDQGLNCNWGRADRAAHPVNCVDWTQARDYCAWTGHAGGARSLPTEAQWEFAARGSEGGRYPWGSEGPGARPCWSGEAPRIGTCAVGALGGDRTATGVVDLAGNVSEWTSNFYAPSYGAPDASVSVDPSGPEASPDGLRVFRGGSWAMSVPTSLRAATRGRHTESVRSRSIGFRCARRR